MAFVIWLWGRLRFMKTHFPEFPIQFLRLSLICPVNVGCGEQCCSSWVLQTDCFPFCFHLQIVLENSSREDKHECPFGRSSIELTKMLCEILKVGELRKLICLTSKNCGVSSVIPEFFQCKDFLPRSISWYSYM